MRILVFDTETSGLDAYWNVILQLSYQIIETDNWSVKKTVNHYFPWPEDKSRVSAGAINVNGLTEEFLAKQNLSDRKSAFTEFVEDKDSCYMLVAHNLDFDKKFIIEGCKHEEVKYASSGWGCTYDTMKRTTNLCCLPKSFGNGYKWPKLIELASFLKVSATDINLHDSSGDVELTVRCFRKLVESGYYSLPQDSGMSVALHVESATDYQFTLITDSGEVKSESWIELNVPKKAWKNAQQELLEKWSEQNEEERAEIVCTIRKTEEIKPEIVFREELDALKPSKYVPKPFEEKAPSKEAVREQLEEEARKNVSSVMFWKTSSMRRQYVEERFDALYKTLYDAYSVRKEQHEKNEETAASDYNAASEIRCWQRKELLEGLLVGNYYAIEESLSKSLSSINLDIPVRVENTEVDKGRIELDLLLPSINDMPKIEGYRLSSGNYKIRDISDKDRRADYAECATGLAFLFASKCFNVSPKVETVVINGFADNTDGEKDKNRVCLYSVEFGLERFRDLGTRSAIALEHIMLFPIQINLSKTNIFKPIDKSPLR